MFRFVLIISGIGMPIPIVFEIPSILSAVLPNNKIFLYASHIINEYNLHVVRIIHRLMYMYIEITKAMMIFKKII